MNQPTQQIAVRIEQDMTLGDLGQVFAASGFFQDATQKAQAIVKIMAGQEFGFPPVVSMSSIYIVKGRPAMAASMMAALVKRSGKYDYRITQHTNELCEIKYLQRIDDQWEEIGVSVFTLADAKRAGTQNIDKFPRNMLFARAMSNGVRWHCADVFMGPVYVPEEMGIAVNEMGDPTPDRAILPPTGRSEGTDVLNQRLKGGEKAPNAASKASEPSGATIPSSGPSTPRSGPDREPEPSPGATNPMPGLTQEPPELLSVESPSPTIDAPVEEGNIPPGTTEGRTEADRAVPEPSMLSQATAEALNMSKADLLQAIPALESALGLDSEQIQKYRLDHLHHVDVTKAHIAAMRVYFAWLSTR
ncbi:MAG: hypothetical protein KKD77_21235 [Gammaproteobacteria bacterium]|nr:hypothetical protein [Gammaproteobacteria bacterium]